MRHALITAGSRGLGRVMTESLLAKGYSVTVNYRSDEQAVALLKENWQEHLDRLQFVKGDMTKREDIVSVVEQTMKRFKRIDFLINNAGPFVFERKHLVDHSDDEWYNMIEGNLSAPFHLLKRVIPIMREQQFGRVINYGFQDAASAPGWQDHAAFAAAKVGLVSLTKSMAIEEASNGITVNMVCPGLILPDMKEATIIEAKQKNDRRTPVGRSATGEDIARPITFLCEEDSEMITGSIIEITGAIDVINRFRDKAD